MDLGNMREKLLSRHIEKGADPGNEVKDSRIGSAEFLCHNWYFIMFLIQSPRFQDGG